MPVRVSLDTGVDPVWVMYAKKYAVRCLADGIRHKTLYVGPVQIIVSTWPESDNARAIVRGGDVVGYQFWGSGDTLYRDVLDERLPALGERYIPRGYLTWVTWRDDPSDVNALVLKATPISSSVEAPVGEEWVFDEFPDPPTSIVAPVHQPDGYGVRQFYSDYLNPGWLMTQWQQGHPCTGMHSVSSIGEAFFYAQDTGFDYGPTRFLTKKGARAVPITSDWYCAATVYKVDDPVYGVRKFIIMVDVNSVFYAYPASGNSGVTIDERGYPGVSGNVSAEVTQSVECPFPAWVTHEPVGYAAFQEDEYLAKRRLRPVWSFRGDGKRAVSVTAKRCDTLFNSRFMSFYQAYDPDLATRPYVKEDIPGLVEVEFTIELNGPDKADFLFSVDLYNDEFSEGQHKVPVAAAYSSVVIPFDGVGENDRIEKGDLVVLYYKHYIYTGTLVDVESPKPGIDQYYFYGTFTYFQSNYGDTTKAIVEVKGVIVREWLASYFQSSPFKFSAVEGFVLDVSYLPTPETVLGTTYDFIPFTEFEYSAQILAFDLSTLSFAIAAICRMNGLTTEREWQIYETTVVSRKGVEAVTTSVVILNNEVSREKIGHEELRDFISDMFDLTATCPNWSNYTPFSASAVFQTTPYFAYHPPHDELPASWDYSIFTEYLNGIDDTVIFTSLDQYYSLGYKLSSYCGATFFTPPGKTWNPAYVGVGTPVDVARYEGSLVNREFLIVVFNTDEMNVAGYWDVPGDYVYYEDLMDTSGFQYGAAHHGRICLETLSPLNVANARLVVHPSGSYAYYFPPIAARESVVDLADPSIDYTQLILDKVFIKQPGRDGNIRTKMTTHMDLFNEAFTKTLVVDDFHLVFSRDDLRIKASFKSFDPDEIPAQYVYDSDTIFIISYLDINGFPVSETLCWTGAVYVGFAMSHRADLRATSVASFSGGRCIHHSFDSSYYYADLHATWNPFTAMPNLKMEGVFHGLRG